MSYLQVSCHLHHPIIFTVRSVDRMYSNFPVIIVKDWSDVFLPDSVEKFSDQIIQRFGNDPFKGVENAMSLSTWAGMIRSVRRFAQNVSTSNLA